jgi:hypothetical protein
MASNGKAQIGAASSNEVSLSVALQANDMPSVPALLNAIAETGKKLSANDTVTRLELLARARDLVRALEAPRETMIKHCWAQPATLAALPICRSKGVFDLMIQDGGKPKKAKDLAVLSSMDPPLLARILRHLAAMGYVKEAAADVYEPTNFTRALTIPIIGDGYLSM